MWLHTTPNLSITVAGSLGSVGPRVTVYVCNQSCTEWDNDPEEGGIMTS